MRTIVIAAALSIGVAAPAIAGELDAKADASRRKEISSKRFERNCADSNSKFADSYAEWTAEYPVRLLCRATPKYPERCMVRAKSFEAVGLIFDVDTEGFTQNIRVSRASNNCLIDPAVDSLLRWKFEASPNGATDLETEVTFELY